MISSQELVEDCATSIISMSIGRGLVELLSGDEAHRIGRGEEVLELNWYLRLEKEVRNKFHNAESETQSNYERIAGMAKEELSICHHVKIVWECAIVHV